MTTMKALPPLRAIVASAYYYSWARTTATTTTTPSTSSGGTRHCQCGDRRRMVTLRGHARVTPTFRMRHHDTNTVRQCDDGLVPPPDPLQLLTPEEQAAATQRVIDWIIETTTGRPRRNEQQHSGPYNILCVTGAGVSTESGIPDYRGAHGSYHKGHQPMTHDQFVATHANRQRYWGRGLVGWQSFAQTTPNAGHVAIAQLEQLRVLGVPLPNNINGGGMADPNILPSPMLALVTQNVDALHRRAGSRHMIELHGRTDELVCLECGTRQDRASFHATLQQMNHSWLQQALRTTGADALRPDGDAAVAVDSYADVQIPACLSCNGDMMKPDVVFFGDVVPRSKVDAVQRAVQGCQGVLVVGTSLTTHSVFRHVRHAYQAGTPVCIINVGPTRAEAEGLLVRDNTIKVEAPAGPTLQGVAEHFRARQ